jgi:hypothetical protein
MMRMMDWITKLLVLGLVCLVSRLASPAFADSPRAGAIGRPVMESGVAPASPQSLFKTDRPGIDGDEFIHGNPTVYEQLMLEMVNRARANPAAEADRLGIDLNQGLPPGTISSAPKPPLAFHPLLIDSARAHSVWMLDTDTFSHHGIDGSDPGDRMSDAGYSFTGSWAWGENIAWSGSTGAIDPTEETIDRHDGLFLSPGHRKNICSDSFQEIGIGIDTGIFTDDRDYHALMVTQNFAKSSATPGPLLLGVVFEDLDGDAFYDPGEGIPGITVTTSSTDWFAVTSESGGYALPYGGRSGAFFVVFSGGQLNTPVEFEMNASGVNQKLDLNLTSLRRLHFIDGSLTYSESNGFEAIVAGAPGDAFILQHSTDLDNWSNVGNYALVWNTIAVSHQPDAPEGPHFYRLIWNH